MLVFTSPLLLSSLICIYGVVGSGLRGGGAPGFADGVEADVVEDTG